MRGNMLYPAFKLSQQKYSLRMEQKTILVTKCLSVLQLPWQSGHETPFVCGLTLRSGCVELRRLLKKKEIEGLPKNVTEVLRKDTLTARDCSVCLRRICKWAGLGVAVRKEQTRSNAGYVTSMMYSVR